MTDAEIDALEAGSELDKMVADACGIVVDYDPKTYGPIKVCRYVDGENLAAFSPSRWWNDAMLALDKIVGTDDSFVADSVSMNCDYRGWQVDLLKTIEWNDGDETNGWEDTPRCVATLASESDDSGPIAICRAILKAVKNAST